MPIQLDCPIGVDVFDEVGKIVCRCSQIASGPYSAISADDPPYEPEEWLRISREIRLHHECSHVVCRRLLPNNIASVWDEITADVVGLLCATGHYDSSLAIRFFGVTPEGFTGGRLSEYLDEEQFSRIDEIAMDVAGACRRIEETCTEADAAESFAYLLRLKDKPLLRY